MPRPIEEMFNFYLSRIYELQRDRTTLKNIYVRLTMYSNELFRDGDYYVFLEAHYDFSRLYLSMWYEPEDWSERKCLNEVEINRQIRGIRRYGFHPDF